MAEPNNLGRASLLSTPSPKSSTNYEPRQCSNVLNNAFFKNAVAVALAVALFGGPLFALADIPDDPGLVLLDVSMVLATLMFCIELVVNFLAIPSYRFSFFFLMDILGTVSMVFEISFLLGGGAVRAVLLRSARAAKLGARAGRIFKLVMCYSLLIRGTEGSPDDGKPRFEAKVLAQRLTTSIATRVAMLTIFLVAFVPLLDLPLFPREDRSMELWAENLEDAFATDSTKLTTRMLNMVEFYSGSDYAPYAVYGWDADLSTSIPAPARQQNSVIIEVDECLVERTSCSGGSSRAAIYFNFTGAHQIVALMEIALVIVIVGIMIAMTHDMGTILSLMMVRPLEKMFGMLLQQAQHLIDICSSEDDEDEDEETRVSELETIERTLAKLSRMAGQALDKNVISKEEMAKKSEYEKAVLVDMLQTEVVGGETIPLLLERKTLGAEHREMEDLLQTWEFDSLSLDDHRQEAMVMHIFFHSDFGVANDFCDATTFKAFYEAVKPNYQQVPYHCFAHACDVLHTVFRLASLSSGGYWMGDVEQYSLLIAALCHDMGHFGKTNPFLVESKHQLAITYNDKSPLENMHCAKLFEICNTPETNAFAKASKDVYKEARKVAVATILHTDNANHFAMIKDITQVYETYETTCEKQAGSTGMLTEYRDKILEPNRLLWMELFLHLADVSNPLKPFHLCKAWAMRVLDEFFQQGDEEKQQGLPVGMLNDRDEVNRPGSQHGFITFLVSPLVVQTIHLFPDFIDLHFQMVTNMEEWRDEWVAEVKPSDEELAKKNADIDKCKATSDRLRSRGRPQKATPIPQRGWSWSNKGKDTE